VPPARHHVLISMSGSLRVLRRIATASAIFAMSCNPSCFGGGTPPATTSANIVVDFPGATATPLLLYSGREGAACVSFTPNVGNPTVTLDDVSYDSSCQVEMDAFAPGMGAFARDIDPLEPGDSDWLVEAIEAGTLSIGMPGLTTIPLKLWLVADAADVPTVESVRDRLLDKAYPIYATMGTGMTFDTASSTLSPSIVPRRCEAADAISTNPAIYDASKINVYFVAHYGNTEGLTPANNCWIKLHPEIVFISWANENLTDPSLAHELGHALGLFHPKGTNGQVGGHTYLYEGPEFSPYNLMASNVDVTEVTIGQLYALNFSSDSWINRAGSPLLKPVVRTCQDSWGTGTCPALTLTQPGWPP
jgi:hypothetical protein